MSELIKRNFAAYIEMDKEELASIDLLIAKMQDAHNLSRWEAISQLFVWGFDEAKERMEKYERERERCPTCGRLMPKED